MFAGSVVCERRKHGAAPSPESYFGRAHFNPFENPAGQIAFVGDYHLSINSLWRPNNTIPIFL
jgi:hypothetical protein